MNLSTAIEFATAALAEKTDDKGSPYINHALRVMEKMDTEEEKMAPWMGALEDNLEVLHKSDAGGEWGRQASMDIIRNRVRVKSMSFMRGRTFLQKFVIIDEAQNLSPKQMKTLITRAGPGTKIVCLGNIAQIDTPYLTEGSSGLTYVVERFQGWEHAATITLTRGERSRLAEFAAEAL